MVFDKDIHSLILDNYPKKPSLVYFDYLCATRLFTWKRISSCHADVAPSHTCIIHLNIPENQLKYKLDGQTGTY